jgi:hypothetical protein
MARPPRLAMAFRDAPDATSLAPQRDPVPTLPGPSATTTVSAPATPRAARSAEYRLTASRSPPNDCPAVIVTSSRPASRSSCTCSENGRGRAAPSVITYAMRSAPAALAPAAAAPTIEWSGTHTAGSPPRVSVARKRSR